MAQFIWDCCRKQPINDAIKLHMTGQLETLRELMSFLRQIDGNLEPLNLI